MVEIASIASVNQQHASDETTQGNAFASDHDLVTTLFDLGRQVTAVLDFDNLLQQIPKLIGRLIDFEAFAVYLLDEKRAELRSVLDWVSGGRARRARMRLGEGLLGTAVVTQEALLVNDLATDPRYVELVPGMNSEIVVPLIHKSRPIGALNILSKRDATTSRRETCRS